MQLRFDRPFEATRVVLRRITAHDQHHVGILHVDPAVGHCTASECGPQTGDRRTVSNPGLRFEIAEPHAAHGFYGKKVQLIGISAAADPTDCFQTIDGVAVLIFLDERGVACFLGPARNLIDGLIPRDVVPAIRTGTSHLWLQQATIVDDFLLERSAFGTQCAPIDRSIRIAFHMDDLRDRVLRFIAKGVNDHATAYRTVWTDTARLGGTLNLQPLCLCIDRSEVESEDTNTRASDQSGLNEGSSGDIHNTYLRQTDFRVTIFQRGSVEGGGVTGVRLGPSTIKVNLFLPRIYAAEINHKPIKLSSIFVYPCSRAQRSSGAA